MTGVLILKANLETETDMHRGNYVNRHEGQRSSAARYKGASGAT